MIGARITLRLVDGMTEALRPAIVALRRLARLFPAPVSVRTGVGGRRHRARRRALACRGIL